MEPEWTTNGSDRFSVHREGADGARLLIPVLTNEDFALVLLVRSSEHAKIARWPGSAREIVETELVEWKYDYYEKLTTVQIRSLGPGGRSFATAARPARRLKMLPRAPIAFSPRLVPRREMLHCWRAAIFPRPSGALDQATGKLWRGLLARYRDAECP